MNPLARWLFCMAVLVLISTPQPAHAQTTHTYNAMGQMMSKTTTGPGAQTILYAYDETGHLLGTYRVDPSAPGGFVTEEEQVFIDDHRMVATVRPDATVGMSAPVIYPVLTDHLGTPRKVLDPNTGFTRWDWDAKEPFGMQAPDENPSAVGVFKLDARFPGQRYDAETGLYHNGFRDYHPVLGRYIQSDPLGLEAGWNTYGYVDGNPVSSTDPTGLMEVYGYQNRGAGVGWVAEYEFKFNPLSAKPLVVMEKAGKMLNRIETGLSFFDTTPAGPHNPNRDYLHCGFLDSKLKSDFEKAGFKDGQRLTREEAEKFINDMRRKHQEMRSLYPTAPEMLNTAEQNSKNWFYKIRGGDR